MIEKRLELVRGLGAWASAAIVVGTMIGTGIFLKPAEMAREGRSVSVVFAAWIIGAILSIFGAFSFAELGSMIPEAGGEYAHLRRHDALPWLSPPCHRRSALHCSPRRSWSHRLDQTLRFCFHLGATAGRRLAAHHDRH